MKIDMNSAQTIYARFKQSALAHQRSAALGWKYENRFCSITYRELLDSVNRCVTGLRKLGVAKESKVAIFSKNRPEWAILDLALNKIGAVSVPIHITLSPRLIKYIIISSGAEFLAIGDFFSKFQTIEKEVCLKAVIALSEIHWRDDLVFWNDLVKEQPDAHEAVESDIASIIFTSGTTGDPKGVVLNNGNFIANIEAAVKYAPITSKDVFLSFLAVSHVLERTGGHFAPLFFGATIFYAESPKTIADDIKKTRPTILISVPRIFEKVYDKIMDTVRRKNPFAQKIFFASLRAARAYLNAKRANSSMKPFFKLTYYLADYFVLKKIRHSLGGRLKFSISGGAPLNPSVAKFFEALGIKVLEGYGLTETSPIISVNPLNNYKFGTVGKVLPGVEVKIAEDKEILVKGPNVMNSYWQNVQATKDAFTEDGFLKTGDLGFLDKENYLTIIGRKKEMIITSNGKNVNPSDLENALVESRYIAQAMVYGDKEKHLHAMIVPDFEELKNYAGEKSISLETFELIKYPPILELYKKEIIEHLNHFPDNEQIGKFYLLGREFSEEREELTPTLKLRRNKILENFKQLIKE